MGRSIALLNSGVELTFQNDTFQAKKQTRWEIGILGHFSFSLLFKRLLQRSRLFMSLELIRAGGGLLPLRDCCNAEGRPFLFSVLRHLKNTNRIIQHLCTVSAFNFCDIYPGSSLFTILFLPSIEHCRFIFS